MLKKGRPSKRRKNIRPLKRLLIICLGEKTEKNYFEGFKTQNGHEVKLVVKGTNRNPSNLVGYALRFTQTHPNKYFQTWLVFDQDNFEQQGDIKKAKAQATQAGFKVAYSIKQFEHWLLLHFGPYPDPLLKEDYLPKLKQEMKKHCGKQYQKNMPELFNLLKTRQSMAIENAKKLKNGQDPSTTVWKLVETLRDFYCPN